MKNNYIKQIFIKIFLLFLLFLSFITLILFSVDNGISINSQIILNHQFAYNDNGFHKKIIEGVCLGEGIKINECSKKNKNFRKKIGFSFSGSSIDSKKFYEHVNYFINIYNVKNFIIPGYSVNDFFKKYMHVFFKKNSNIKFIGIDTENNHEIWPKNFWQINFLHYFSGYHAGIFASAWALENHEKLKDADLNKDGKQIHFSSVGGVSIPVILKYALGFKLGINIFNKVYQKYRNKKIEKIEFIHTNYDEIGSFDASNIIYKKKAKTIVKNQFLKGSSIVFLIAISFLNNAINATFDADDENIEKKEHFIVGVDVNSRKMISKQHKKKIITSAMLDFTKIINNIYYDDFKSNSDGKDLIIGGHEFGTIPKIDKTTKTKTFKNQNIWEKYFLKDKNFKNIIDLSNLPLFVLDNDEQIVKINSKIEKNEISKKENQGLIYQYIMYLISIPVDEREKEYKNVLKDLNPIQYIKKKL